LSKLIVDCFEEIRDGLSPDYVLADPARAKRFALRCRQKGIELSTESIFRRLLAIRKNPKTYNVKIQKSTDGEQLISEELEQFIDAAEFALMRLRYTQHASIDDILVVPEVGEQFDLICSEIAPGYRPLDYRLAALHIRKTRYLEKAKKNKVANLDSTKIDQALEPAGMLADVKASSMPSGYGLFTLEHQDDGQQYVYTATRDMVADNVMRLQHGTFWDRVVGDFWQPRLDRILVRTCNKAKIGGVPLRMYELKLIQERHPLFNLPVSGKAA
jgi:site-specific DNA-methyltransferase (adenine-specific)